MVDKINVYRTAAQNVLHAASQLDTIILEDIAPQNSLLTPAKEDTNSLDIRAGLFLSSRTKITYTLSRENLPVTVIVRERFPLTYQLSHHPLNHLSPFFWKSTVRFKVIQLMMRIFHRDQFNFSTYLFDRDHRFSAEVYSVDTWKATRITSRWLTSYVYIKSNYSFQVEPTKLLRIQKTLKSHWSHEPRSPGKISVFNVSGIKSAQCADHLWSKFAQRTVVLLRSVK